jgi:hypothetical protein
MNVITNTTVLPEQFESVEEAADFRAATPGAARSTTVAW